MRMLIVALLLASCRIQAAAPDAWVAACAPMAAMLARARDAAAPDEVRVDAWHTMFQLAKSSGCELTSLTPEFESYLAEILAICVVLEIHAGAVRQTARVDLSKIRVAIDDVGGPLRATRHARLSNCALELAKANCAQANDRLEECLRTAAYRLLH